MVSAMQAERLSNCRRLVAPLAWRIIGCDQSAILAKIAIRRRWTYFRFHETESGCMFGWCRCHWLQCLFATPGWRYNALDGLSYRASWNALVGKVIYLCFQPVFITRHAPTILLLLRVRSWIFSQCRFKDLTDLYLMITKLDVIYCFVLNPLRHHKGLGKLTCHIIRNHTKLWEK